MSDAVYDDRRTNIERKPDGAFRRAAMGRMKRKFRNLVLEEDFITQEDVEICRRGVVALV